MNARLLKSEIGEEQRQMLNKFVDISLRYKVLVLTAFAIIIFLGSRAWLGITLNTIFVLLEAVYGVLSHSLALLADAGHNMSDVLGLVLAWGATLLAKKLPSLPVKREYSQDEDSDEPFGSGELEFVAIGDLIADCTRWTVAVVEVTIQNSAGIGSRP